MKYRFLPMIFVSTLLLVGLSLNLSGDFVWRIPVNISQSYDDSSLWPDIEFGADGLVHICWVEDWTGWRGSDIFYATYDGSKWTTLKLTKSGSIHKHHPNIGVGKDGTIIVVWDQYENFTERIYCRIYDPKTNQWAAQKEISANYPGKKPRVVVDSEGNIHASWFQEKGGRSVSRSRVNGAWEDVVNQSAPYVGHRSTETDIFCAPNNTIWMVFRIKLKFNWGNEYKTRYTKRPFGGKWVPPRVVNDGGAGMDHPSIVVGPDNIPYIYYQDLVAVASEIFQTKVDEKTNPRSRIRDLALIHFPFGAIDSNGVHHVIFQYGAGDNGRGILYFYNDGKDGSGWSKEVKLPNSSGGPKIANIQADDFGNVAAVWESAGTSGYKNIWFSSLYPITPRGIKEPLNLSFSLKVDNLAGNTQVVYNLTWEHNPENKADNLKGYNIYRKEVGGEYTLFEEVSADVVSRQVVVTNELKRYFFAITSTSNTGYESKKVEFFNTED